MGYEHDRSAGGVLFEAVETTKNPAIRSPFVPSLCTAACALLIHPWGGENFERAISLELRDGNVLAYLTLLGLAWVILTLCTSFWRSGLYLSAAACAVCVALLVVIPSTAPRSELHNLANIGLVVISIGLFLLWAIDTLDVMQVLPPFLPIVFGGPFYASFGAGGLQLLLIGSLLIALNLTFAHLRRRERW